MGHILMQKTVPVDDVLESICECIPDNYREGVKLAIVAHFSGQLVYFPASLIKERRNAEILRRFFDGETRTALCREYQISRTKFYRILRKHYAKAKKCHSLKENGTVDVE